MTYTSNLLLKFLFVIVSTNLILNQCTAEDVLQNEDSKEQAIKKEEPSEPEKIPLRDILLNLIPANLRDEEDDNESKSTLKSNDDEKPTKIIRKTCKSERIALKHLLNPKPDNVCCREDGYNNKRYSIHEDEDEDGAIYSPMITTDNDTEGASSGVSDVLSQSINSTEDNNGTSTPPYTSKRAFCETLLDRDEPITNVKIISASALLKILHNDPSITSRSSEAICYLVYFFSPYCPFSAAGSPYINALARSLPNIAVYGLNSIEYHSVNSRYGVMGTPSLLLFHNGLISGRYNASEYSTYNLINFINYFTTEEITSVNVTSDDFKCDLPCEVTHAPSYTLYLAWMFIISCGSWLFFTSETFDKMSELFLNNWREAEAQHAHAD